MSHMQPTQSATGTLWGQQPEPQNRVVKESLTTAPYQRHSKPSRDAARRQTPSKAERDRQTILEAIRAQGRTGLTDEQIHLTTGIKENTARPRRLDLVRRGDIEQRGERETASGGTAAVWVARGAA